MKFAEVASDERGGGHPVARGLVFALAVATLLMLLAASLMMVNDALDQRLPYVTYTIHVVAVLVGAFVAAGRVGEKGWYQGGLTALAYVLIVLGVDLLLYKGAGFSIMDILRAGILMVIGGFGGMVGVGVRQQ